MKERKLQLAMIPLFILLAFLIFSAKGFAKTRETCYYETFNSRYGMDPHLTYSTIKGNKLILKGSLKRTKKEYGEGPILRSKRRVFKLTKKTKYYGTDPETGAWRMRKKECKKILKSMNGLGVIFRVKKGKVVWIMFVS